MDWCWFDLSAVDILDSTILRPASSLSSGVLGLTVVLAILVCLVLNHPLWLFLECGLCLLRWWRVTLTWVLIVVVHRGCGDLSVSWFLVCCVCRSFAGRFFSSVAWLLISLCFLLCVYTSSVKCTSLRHNVAYELVGCHVLCTLLQPPISPALQVLFWFT